MPKKILIAGYYGCGNAGDDMLLAALTHRLKNYSCELSALSGNPTQTEKFCSVQSYKRMHFKSVVQAIKKCDVLIFGGGSIFQDSTSVKSMMYYYWLIYLAKTLKKKVYLLGQGVGPIHTVRGQKILKGALHLTDWIFVRDEKSYKICQSLAPKLEVDLGADLAFLFSFLPEINKRKSLVGISLRPYKDKVTTLKIGEHILKLVLDKGYTPCWWIMHPHMDEAIVNQLDPMFQYKRISIDEKQSPQDFLKQIGESTYAITMRLHAGIFALLNCINPLVISYDPKVTAFAKENDLECWNIKQEQELKQLWEKTLIKPTPDIEKNRLLVEKQFEKLIKLLNL